MNAQQTRQWIAHAAVRVPRDDGPDIEEHLHRRLTTPTTVDDVEIISLEGIKPGLSATLVTVAVRVSAGADSAGTIKHRLSGAPGVESIEAVEQG